MSKKHSENNVRSVDHQLEAQFGQTVGFCDLTPAKEANCRVMTNPNVAEKDTLRPPFRIVGNPLRNRMINM